MVFLYFFKTKTFVHIIHYRKEHSLNKLPQLSHSIQAAGKNRKENDIAIQNSHFALGKM
jgi:hypothetical protein